MVKIVLKMEFRVRKGEKGLEIFGSREDEDAINICYLGIDTERQDRTELDKDRKECR